MGQKLKLVVGTRTAAKSRTVIIRDVRMLRDARTTAMRKLHRGVKSAGQRQDWAGRVGQGNAASARVGPLTGRSW